MIKYWKKIVENFGKSKILEVALLIFIIALIIDYFNLITWTIDNNFIVIIFALAIWIFTKICRFELNKILNLRSINAADLVFLGAKISIFFYWAAYFPTINSEFEGMFIFRIILTGILLLLCAGVSIHRMRYTREYKGKKQRNAQNEENRKDNVYTLKDLYENNIDKIDSNVIIIEEKDVSYDLLKRKENISYELATLLSNCENENSIAIAIKGACGSGKTTIINQAKDLLVLNNNVTRNNESNMVIIDDFEPWNYQDEKSLFVGMLEAIYNALGINLKIREMNSFLGMFKLDFIKYVKYEKVQEHLYDFFINPKLNNNKLIERIGEDLRKTGKRIIFITDNIEKMDKNLVVFFLKTINNVLNIRNVIYLSAYDDDIMTKDLGLRDEHLKKFTQIEVQVPKVSYDVRKDVIGTCLRNLLNLYEITYDNKELENTVEILAKLFDTIRDFIIYLNSVISFHNNVVLMQLFNVEDFLLLEFIKMKNNELYNEIWINKKSFVGTDIFSSINYLVNVCKKYSAYEDILKKMFPKLGNIYSIIKNGTISTQKIKIEAHARRICDEQCINFYFTYNEDIYTYVDKFFSTFESNIQVPQNNGIADGIFLSFMDKKHVSSNNTQFEKSREVFLELIYYYFVVRDNKNCKNLLKIMLKNINSFEPRLNAEEKKLTENIWKNLLVKLQDNEKEEIIDIIKTDYSKLVFLDKAEDKLDVGMKRKVKEIKEDMINDIINKKINMLDDGFYHEGNINCICEYYKDNGNTTEIKNYFNVILSKKNNYLYRLLIDLEKYLPDENGDNGTIWEYINVQDLEDAVIELNRENSKDELGLIKKFKERLS